MTRELVETAITDIDDRYIMEALTYRRNKVRKFPGATSKLIKAATVTLAVLAVGTATIYAGASVIKKVFFTEHSMSTGNPDYVVDEEVVRDAEPAQVEDKGTVQGDSSVKWISKHEETVNGNNNTYYTYRGYEDAATDAGLDMWFNTVPGKVENVDYIYSDDGGTTVKNIQLTSVYNGHAFFINEEVWAGNFADDMAYSIPFANKQNEREYTNVNGKLFVLADEVSEREEYNDANELETVKVVDTYAMIRYEGYYGYIMFENMPDEDIHDILDQMILGE